MDSFSLLGHTVIFYRLKEGPPTEPVKREKQIALNPNPICKNRLGYNLKVTLKIFNFQ